MLATEEDAEAGAAAHPRVGVGGLPSRVGRSVEDAEHHLVRGPALRRAPRASHALAAGRLLLQLAVAHPHLADRRLQVLLAPWRAEVPHDAGVPTAEGTPPLEQEGGRKGQVAEAQARTHGYADADERPSVRPSATTPLRRQAATPCRPRDAAAKTSRTPSWLCFALTSALHRGHCTARRCGIPQV